MNLLHGNQIETKIHRQHLESQRQSNRHQNEANYQFDYTLSKNVIDIDLYYQPVHRPVTAVSVFALRMGMVTIGELVQIKLLRMMKKETGLVSEVAKLYVGALMTLGPILLLFTH